MINKRVHVLGGGSIGLLWSCCLQQSGYDVHLVVRNATETSATLRLNNGDSAATEHPVTLTDATHATQIQQLLVCTKAFDAPLAVQSVTHALTLDASIHLLQNGMGSQQAIAHEYPQNPVFVGVSTEGALKTERFSVSHTGRGATRWGKLDDTPRSLVDQKYSMLFETSLTQHVEHNIEKALWQKLVINACINPLTVIFDCKNGKLAQIADAVDTIDRVIDECCKVLTATTSEQTAQAYLGNIRETVFDVIHKTAANSSSMRQDIANGRRSEIDFINGYLVKRGAEVNVAMPVNACITAKIIELTQ